MPTDTLRSTKLLASIQNKIDDKDIYEFYKAIVNDIDEFKKSLLGISRDGGGQLLIYNQPIASAQGDQLVLLLNKLGQVALLQREPDFSYANLDVGGPRHIFGTPARIRLAKNTDTAGAGIYIWDVTPFNNEPDMYVTAAGVTTITSRGHYRIVAVVHAENAAGAGTLTDIKKNGALVIQSNGPVMAAGNYYTHVLFFEDELVPGDTIQVDLAVGVTRIGAGANTSNLFITRVN